MSFMFLHIPVCLAGNVLIATHLGSEVCKLTFSKFKKLTKDEENEFKIEAASIMYAVVPWVLSIYLVIFDDAIRDNKLEGYSFGAQWNVAFVMGHSFADVLLRYKWSVGRHPSVFIYHICGIGVTGLVALVDDTMFYLASWRLYTALPSPLFLYRVMVRLLELDGTTVGVKLRRIFFGIDICCRICLTPVYYLFYSSILEAVSEPDQVSIAIFVCWLVSALTIDLINVYWFVRIFKTQLT
ncbi:unnamed protein product [Clavelina lepadiformis]|uniref:TLC domain-containing protein n=1 Tax=Clavelina lepadiformis TaxID=159417 RepID=A0ABP0FRK8_CLALP